MFTFTRPCLLKGTGPKYFFVRICKNIIEDLFQNFSAFLGITTSCICLLKSQSFASSVPFNVIAIV